MAMAAAVPVTAGEGLADRHLLGHTVTHCIQSMHCPEQMVSVFSKETLMPQVLSQRPQCVQAGSSR